MRRRLGGGGPDGLVALHLAHHQQAEAARLPRGRQEPRQQEQQGVRWQFQQAGWQDGFSSLCR